MRIKLHGRASTAVEMMNRIIDALKELPLDEIASFSGVNLYFNAFDENNNEVTFVDKNNNPITAIVNRVPNKKVKAKMNS